VECSEAFRIARSAHPSAVKVGKHEASPAYDGGADDDMEFWDAWALLGDVGAGPARGV
jgi:hypothetical protein